MSIAVDNNTKSGYYDSVDGKVHTGERMKIGYGLPGREDWETDFPFTDFLTARRTTRLEQGTGTRDASGWWDLDSGAYATYYFWDAGGIGTKAENYWADENWVLRWDGTATASQVYIGTGLGSPVGTIIGTPTNGRKVYSFPTIVTKSVIVDATSSAAYAYNITLVRESQEADFHTTGNTINPTFITETANAYCLRFMDPMSTNDGIADTDTEYAGNWPHPQERNRISMEGIAEIVNATNTIPWICVPVAMQDYGLALANELAIYYTSGQIIVEYTNEYWNTGFGNTSKYVEYGDILTHTNIESGMVSGLVNSPAHGGSNGNIVIFHTRPGADTGADWPYYNGATHMMIKHDANNFYTCYTGWLGTDRYTTSAITNSDPCVVTAVGHNYSIGRTVKLWNTGISQMDADGVYFTVDAVNGDDITLNTDSSLYDVYTPSGTPRIARLRTASRDKLRYKNVDGSSGWAARNYAERAADTWDAWDSVFGRDRIIAAGGTQLHWAGNHTNGQLGSVRYKERLDYLAIAPYWSIFGHTAGTQSQRKIDILTETDTEITDWVIANEFPWIQEALDEQLSYLDHNRLCCYEGGDESCYTANDSTAVWDRYLSWKDSSEGTRLFDAHLKLLADNGVVFHTHFQLANRTPITRDSSGFSWGLTKYIGQTDPKLTLFKDYAALGGAPKN